LHGTFVQVCLCLAHLFDEKASKFVVSFKLLAYYLTTLFSKAEGVAMRKAILMMLLAMVSSNAMAEWVKVGENEENADYADTSSILKNGNKVIILSLSDFKTPQTVASYTFLSSKRQAEFDCKEEQHRVLSFDWHSENMGKGQVVFASSGTGKWEPVLLNSVVHTIWQFACGKK
jgi:hypothetical protein